MDRRERKDFLLTKTPLASPRVRRAVREARRTRRTLFERAGSDRYSHPALDDLDKKLLPYLPAHGGVFVEAGAFDGFWQSNTYWLERFRGWTGVLVEPVPELAARARIERPASQVFAVALVGRDYDRDHIRMRVGGTMSTLIEGEQHGFDAVAHAQQGSVIAHSMSYETEVPTKTLSEVLDEAAISDVDLLSLDVEGHEHEVLMGLDFERHAPAYMLVEILEADRFLPLVNSALGNRYEFVDRLSPRDYLFARSV